MRDITPAVAPRSVAVVGASSNTAKSGGILFKNLVEGGFAGPLHPVNPRAAEVLGRRAYPGLAALPEPVDLAFIVLPRDGVEPALRDCVTSGTRAACVITAGFGEADEAGRRAEAAIRALVRETGLLTLGPNTIGTINADIRLMGSFVPFPRWERGPVALFAQTGVFAGNVMLQEMSRPAQRLGVGKSVDAGNKVDVDEVDFLRWVATDPATTVVGLYLEDLREPGAFLPLAAEVGRTRPIVVLKPGRTAEAAAASARHTGARAADDAALDAALAAQGILRADDVEDFLAYLRVLSTQPPPRGPRLGIVTYSGALGVVATDQALGAGLRLAELGPQTRARVASVVPGWVPVANPADLWVAVDAGARAAAETPLDAVLGDPGVDMLLGVLLAAPVADFEGFGEVFAGLRRRHPDVPMALVMVGGAVRDRWLGELEGLGLPVFDSTRQAVRALAALARYARARSA